MLLTDTGMCGFLMDVNESERDSMDRNHLEKCHGLGATDAVISTSTPHLTRSASAQAHAYVSLEAEIPEVLYCGMKDFIGDHPSWGSIPGDEFGASPLSFPKRQRQSGRERALPRRFVYTVRALRARRQARRLIAIIVSVGDCQADVGQQAPSTTSTFGALHS